ncbi:MAG: hypothetical protein R3F20_20025, partial [Planctomycetota bacterium]
TASGALLDRLVAILAATPGAALEGARQGGAGPLFLAAGALVCALRFNGPRPPSRRRRLAELLALHLAAALVTWLAGGRT